MAVERKMPVKSLSFAPGTPAVTPFAADGAVSVRDSEAEVSPASDESSRQSSPTLKGVLVYLAPAEAIALKVYAAQNSTSIQQLGTEAFADLFRKRGINNGLLTRVRANRKNGGNR